MKKLYLLVFFLGFSLHYTAAQFLTQYFDGADTSALNAILIDIDSSGSNVWQIGQPQKIIFDSAFTAPNVIVTDTINSYPINDTSRFIAKIYNNIGFSNILALQWTQKLDLDSGFDGGIIEFSTDTGITWVNVFNNPFVYNFYGYQLANADTLQGGEFAFSGTDSTWRDIWLCLDLSWIWQIQVVDTILFRFTLISDSIDNNREGWMIDNMLAHITFIHTVNEKEQLRYLNVHPNPANGIIYVETEKRMDFHIIEKMELIDPLGRVIDRWTNIPTKFWFDSAKYNSGLYYLKIKTNIKSETVPLVISRN